MEPKLFFTADTHYHHKNICRGESRWTNKSGCRNFDTLEEMDQNIIDGINSVVGPNDILFHLGDFSFGEPKDYKRFRSQLICQNIHLVLGNHDGFIIRNDDDLQSLFSSTKFYAEVTYNSQKIIMSHYAMRVWNMSHQGSWMLYGHSHGSLQPSICGELVNHLIEKKKYADLKMLTKGTHPDYHANGKSMDVGVDTHPSFRPYSFDEISKIMKNRQIMHVDNH
jgi:calcineurin-like phosphoesterase family protein